MQEEFVGLIDYLTPLCVGSANQSPLTFGVGPIDIGGMDVETLIQMAGGARELGARLGVARTTVLDWKRSRLIPGSRVGQIAEEFGIPADDLVKIVQPPRSNGTNHEAAAAVIPGA